MAKTIFEEKYFITVNLKQSVVTLKQENNFHAECWNHKTGIMDTFKFAFTEGIFLENFKQT